MTLIVVHRRIIQYYFCIGAITSGPICIILHKFTSCCCNSGTGMNFHSTTITLFETTLRYMDIGSNPITKQTKPCCICDNKLFNFNILFAMHTKSTKYCRFAFTFADDCHVATTDTGMIPITAQYKTHHFVFALSYFNFHRILPRAVVSFRKHHGQVQRLVHGWAPFRHSNDIQLQHVLPILLKERIATAQRGQRLQVQKLVHDLVNPDILGQIDPVGRGQQGSAWKNRSEGCNREFLALGGWRRGRTVGASVSAVGFC